MTLDKTFNTYTSIPGFYYRSPESIKGEIKKITARIEELQRTLNVRGLLMDMLIECAGREPEKWCSEVKELGELTARGLERLRRLSGVLESLLTEWREAKCAMGI